jgi:hypothetical protein
VKLYEGKSKSKDNFSCDIGSIDEGCRYKQYKHVVLKLRSKTIPGRTEELALTKFHL